MNSEKLIKQTIKFIAKEYSLEYEELKLNAKKYIHKYFSHQY